MDIHWYSRDLVQKKELSTGLLLESRMGMLVLM